MPLCIQSMITALKTVGFPHSEICGSKSVSRLTAAYRRLQRPSSPPVAKASTVCAYSLDHITPKSLGLVRESFNFASTNATYPTVYRFEEYTVIWTVFTEKTHKEFMNTVAPL